MEVTFFTSAALSGRIRFSVPVSYDCSFSLYIQQKGAFLTFKSIFRDKKTGDYHVMMKRNVRYIRECP
jgi:hypothetical protein